MRRYRFVATERATFPVRVLCRIVGVAVSGFYAWLRRGPARRREDDRRLGARIAAIRPAKPASSPARRPGPRRSQA